MSSKCDSDILFSLVEASLKHRANLSEKECEKIINKIYNYYLKITNNEDLYLNQNIFGYNAKDIFLLNTESLVHLFYVFDENTIETLFRKRLNYVHNYLQEFESYELKEDILDLLKDLSASKKEKRKPLSEQEKLNLLYILKTNIKKRLDLSKLENMAENRTIDLFELYKDLYNNLFQIIGYSEKEISEIPKEKLFSWNLQYMPLIYQSLEKNLKGFRTLFDASFKDDFMAYIHDEKSSLGEANNKTKELFKKNWINYEKWLNPSKENEVRFVARNQTSKSMIEIADKLIADIESLRQTGLKTFFDRRYANFIKDNEFRIPQDILNSKTKFTAFVKNILTQLEPAWKRANANKNDMNGNKNFNASKTLEIKQNLEERLSEVHKLNNDKENQVLDLTIKMWDRIPQKDLFQGNYSTCCIRMGGSNGHVMPNYILNTAFNMIEIFDNISGKIIGNALCYFAKDNTETLNFIIDNIEINNSMIPAKDVSEKLIDAIIKYASNICKEVTGKTRTISIGTNYNTLAINKKTCDDTITLLGNIDCERIYLDAYGGWIHTSLLKHKSSLHKIY